MPLRTAFTVLNSLRPLALALLGLLGLLGVLAAVSPATAGDSDPKAIAIAEHTLQAMGGEDGWDSVRHLHFNFANFRTHTWDTTTGHHRLEGKTRAGDEYVILHNLNTREGKAWKNGEAVEGEEHEELLEMAYGAWVNDTYWLLAPFKLRDPGVTLAYEGQETLEETTYEVLRLTFDSVGLTPGDTYWVYVNADTGLVGRWSYVLESADEGAEPTVWKWTDWQSYGPVKLSSGRSLVGGERQLPLTDIAVHDTLPEAVYTHPETPVAP